MNRYYRKHLLRTVARRPLQPVLIVFILMLSFFLIELGVSTQAGMSAEYAARMEAKEGDADYRLSTGAGSPSRFLFPEDVQRVCPDTAVVSSFSLPLIQDNALVSAAAVSLGSIGDVFEISLCEYEDIPASDLSRVALITRAYADAHGVGLGDTLTFDVFRLSVSYRVAGISERPFLGECDILTDVSGVRDLLLGDSPLALLIPDTFSPGGTLYIRALDRARVGELGDALSAAFPEYTLVHAGEDDNSMAVAGTRAISFALIVLTVLCAFCVMYCCSYCMSRERAEDASFFALCGVRRSELLLYQIFEMCVYAVFGALGGFLLCVLFGQYAFDALAFRFLRYTVDAGPMVIAFGSILVISAVTPVLFSGKGEKTRTRAVPLPFTLSLFGAVALLVGLMYIVQPNERYIPALLLLTLSTLVLIVYLPRLFAAVCRLLAAKCRGITSRLAFNNASRVSALGNTFRLVSILCGIVAAVMMTSTASFRFIRYVPRWFNCDYVVAGGTARAYDAIADLDEVESVWGFSQYDFPINGKHARCWAASDSALFSPVFHMSDDLMPHGDEITVSKSFSSFFGVALGDSFDLTVGSVTRRVTVTHVLEGDMQFLFDVSAFGLSYSSFCVKGKEGVSETELYAALTEALSMETVSVLPSSSIADRHVQNNKIYVTFEILLSAFLLVFSVIGVADTLEESYRSRREELGLFLTAGMSRRTRRRMIVKENLILFGFSLIAGAVIFVWYYFLITRAAFAFGVDIVQYNTALFD